MLFNELRKHGKLADKRHPMFEQNKFGKYFTIFMSLFWAGYLVFFGVVLALGLGESQNMEAYHLMNQGLFIILILDYLMRFPFQKLPTQEVKPYLLLPIKKKRLIDFLLIRSGISSYNLLWLFLFVPFATLSVSKFYGITGVLGYNIGICLLCVLNNYWYTLSRTLINEKIYWIGLPLLIYGLLALIEFLPEGHILSTFTMNLGEGFIECNPLAFIGTIASIVGLWWICRTVIGKFIYAELSKVEDTKVKTVSEYKFFDKYGEVGEYARLELKMLFRNKRTKSTLRMIGIIVVLFSAILSFGDVYDGKFMSNFIIIYSFSAFGLSILTQLMGFEGNYLDGLMTRKESILSLLKAKYYFYSICILIPFALVIPTIIAGKTTWLSAFSFASFTVGTIYFMLFQMAVYNTKTVPLNEGITGRQASGTGYQNLISMAAFGLPLGLYFTLEAAFGATTAQWIILFIGVGFVITSPLWIHNIYLRFMKRRYRNMEGFRDTK